MEIEINGKNYELAFGLKFIRNLDEIYKQNIDGMEFGIGVETAIMYLQLKNPPVIYDLIKAGTSHLRSKPSNVDIENEMEKMAEADELFDWFDKFKIAMEESAFLKPKLKNITEMTKNVETVEQKEEK